MGLYKNKNAVTLIDEAALADGTAPQSSREVLAGLEDRPNGLYAYAYAILMTLVFTATPSSTDHCPAVKLWQVLKAVSIQYAKTYKRCNSLSGLNIVRLGYQCDELYSPDLVASCFPVQELTDSGGAQVVTMNILYPLAIAQVDSKGDESARYTGLVPFSALKHGGEIAVQICAAATISTNWTIGKVALKVQLLEVDLVDPVPHVAVSEIWEDYSTKRAVLPGDGDRLYSCIMGTDDADAAFTLPASMTVEADGKVIRNLVTGAELVLEENFNRQDGINDVAPAVCPVLTRTNRCLDECLAVHNSIVLENMNDAHGGNYGVLVRYSQHLDANSQRAILKAHRVPAALIDAYIAQQQGRSAAQAELEIGRVTSALRAV